jgi:hypothetical protein
MYVYVILFLAHEGVTQPALWEMWKSGFEDAARRSGTGAVLRYAVHCPGNPRYGGSFCRKYRLRGLPFRQTSWCSPALVYAYTRCIDALLRDHDIVSAAGASIFLVSGYDIPIAPVERLLDPVFREKDHLCYIRERSHYQWIMVRRGTARTIRDRLFDPVRFARFFMYALEHPGCSDEYMLRYVYTSMGSADKEGCITRDFRPMLNAPSPVVFNKDKHDRYRVTFGKLGTFTLSMNEILLATRIYDYNHSVLFFRKIGAYMDLSSDVLIRDVIWDNDQTKKSLILVYDNLFPGSPIRFHRTTGRLFPVVTAESYPRIENKIIKKRERVLAMLQRRGLVDPSIQGTLVEWYDACSPQKRRGLVRFLSHHGFDIEAILRS